MADKSKEEKVPKLTKTAKIKLHASIEAQKELDDTVVAYTKACNYLSSVVFETGLKSQPKLHKITYAILREEYDMPSQMAQSAMKTVLARYKAARTNGHRLKNRIQFRKGEYDLVYNRDYSLKKDGRFSLNTVNAGRVKVSFETKGMLGYFDGTWEYGTAKLIRTKRGYFLHIPMTREIEKFEYTKTTPVTGIDLGQNFLAVSADKKGRSRFYKGRHVKDKRARFKEKRTQLQKRGTASARRRLKRIGHRENRWMRDVNHCVSKALVENAEPKTLFAIEDLTGIRQATVKVRKKNRYVSVSWAFYDLRQKLEYKAKEAGMEVIALDPKYSSQCCPKCGNTDRHNRDKRRHAFKCKVCNYQSNDDRIGGINMRMRGEKYLNEKISLVTEACPDGQGRSQSSRDASLRTGDKRRKAKAVRTAEQMQAPSIASA